MAINGSADLTHIIRSTKQWADTFDKSEIIPSGVLCVEFTPEKSTLIKIGDGHHRYADLPYVTGTSIDLSDYYTKEEVDAKFPDNIVTIKGLTNNSSNIPETGENGDLWFVENTDKDGNKIYDHYIWYDGEWRYCKSTSGEIDIREYVEQIVNEFISALRKAGELHTHKNKEILDNTTASYTKEEKEKLKTLENYDDTELRDLIKNIVTHSHDNKEILDRITAAFTKEYEDKLNSLENYDDTAVLKAIEELQKLAHSHDNKDILDKTTAAFTTEYEFLLQYIRVYTGATLNDNGIMGLVPPAERGQEDYVLNGAGEWVPMEGGSGIGDITAGPGIEIEVEDETVDEESNSYKISVKPATNESLGGIIVGEGLEVLEDGTINVVSGSSTQYIPGAAIDFILVDKIHTEIDCWNNGTDWSNLTYTDTTSTITQAYSSTYHSPISQDLLFKVPDDKKGTIILKSTDNRDLEIYFDLYNSSKVKYNSIGPKYNEDEVIFLSDAEYFSVSVTIKPFSSRIPINASNIAEVTLLEKSSQTSINVKHGDGLTINDDNKLEVKIGDGLRFDENGVLIASIPTSATEYAPGEGISFDSNVEVFKVNPNMTSDTAPYGQVIYSMQRSGREGFRAFDGTDSQTWESSVWCTPGTSGKLSGNPNDVYIGYMFDKEYLLTKFTISFFSNEQTIHGIIQVHKNDSWITVVDDIDIPKTPNYNKFIRDIPPIICDGFRYCALSSSNGYFAYNDSYGANVCEFEAYGTDRIEEESIIINNTGVLDVKPSEEKNQIIVTTKDGDKPINIDIESDQGVLDVKPSSNPNQIIITTADGDKTVDIDISVPSAEVGGYYEGEAIYFTDKPDEIISKANPIMTSYNTPEGQVIYSGEYPGRPAYGPFDGVDSKTWDIHAWSDNVSVIDGTPDACYDGYLFGKEVTLSKFIISFNGTTEYTAVIQAHTTNGWEIVVDEFTIPINYNVLEFTIDPITCDGFRCSIISSVNGNPYFSTQYYGSNICNFEAWGSKISKVINVKYGDGLTVNEDNQLEVDLNTDSGLEIYQTPEDTTKTIALLPATSSTIGGIIVGNGLNIDENGVLTVSTQTSGAGYVPGKAIEFTEDASSIIVSKLRWIIKETLGNTNILQVARVQFFIKNESEVSLMYLKSVSGVLDTGEPIISPDRDDETIKNIIDYGTPTANSKFVMINWNTNMYDLLIDFELESPINAYDLVSFRYAQATDYLTYPERCPISWDIQAYDEVNEVWFTIQSTTDYTIDSASTWTKTFPINIEYKNAINVKYGDGLTVNEDNELIVKIGDGLTIDDNGVLSVINKPVDTSKYVAGEAISIIESQSGEYDVLEYVISSQTQYVLTDIFPGDTTEIYLKYQFTNTSTDSYIVSSGYKFTQGCLMYGILLTNREVLCSAIGTGNNIYAYNSIIPDLDIHEDTYTVTSTTFGSTLTGTNNHSYTLNKTEPIQLFGTPGLSYGASVKLYAMKITVDGSLISELIPVRNKAASNVGLYDKLTGKIYYSKEGTKLEAGPSTGEIIKITGDNIINVKYSDGLSINENNELFVDGKEDTIPRFTKAEYEQAVLDGTAPPPGSLFIITDDEEEHDIPEYELPIASKEVLGGIKVGEGLVINNDGVLSMDNIHAYQVDMKDYQPGNDYIPIEQSDSVSAAIGKLDVGLITKENKIRRFTKAEYDQAVLDGTGPKPGELFVITDDYTTQIDPEQPFGVTDVVATPNEVGKLNVYKDGEVKTVDVFEYLELMTLNCVGDGEAP